jgi:crossover junction endodeoxyribonuclease RuvC
MRVIGIDPGLRRMGWGVVEQRGGRLSAVAQGVCRSGEGALAERLAALYEALEGVLHAHAPDAAAVEQTFVNRDAAGTLKLGQARAVALLVPARAGIPVAEYAPNAVKKAVVGVGHADKGQVEHMVRMLLPGALPESADAADALAIALCHAWTAGAGARRAGALARAGRAP